MTVVMAEKKNELAASIQQLKLDQFVVLKKLGNGQFGSVYLVKELKSKKTYALKCISKAMVIEQQLEKYLESEKMVM